MEENGGSCDLRTVQEVKCLDISDSLDNEVSQGMWDLLASWFFFPHYYPKSAASLRAWPVVLLAHGMGTELYLNCS